MKTLGQNLNERFLIFPLLFVAFGLKSAGSVSSGIE